MPECRSECTWPKQAEHVLAEQQTHSKRLNSHSNELHATQRETAELRGAVDRHTDSISKICDTLREVAKMNTDIEIIKNRLDTLNDRQDKRGSAWAVVLVQGLSSIGTLIVGAILLKMRGAI